MLNNALLQVISYLQAQRRVDRDRGATAVEYGLIVAVIALVVVGGAAFFGTSLSTIFMKAGSSVSSKAP